MKLKYILSTIALASSAFTFAQSNHELSVHAGGGLSTLNYKQSLGKQENGLGGNVGVGYTYFFNQSWGIATGAELAAYNAKATLSGFSDKYDASDIVSDLFEFRTRVDNYREKQPLMQLNIPLMIRYRGAENNKFYAALGGKIGLPINKKYSVESATIKNSGYYEFEDVEYTTQEFAGFGTFTNRRDKGNFDAKLAFMVSAEAGLRFPMGEKNAIYTGVYADYGLNNILKSGNSNRFIQYDARSSELFQVNSIFNAQYNEGGSIKKITDKVTPLTVGIKLQFGFGL